MKYKFRAIDQFTDDFIFAPAFFVSPDNNQGYLAFDIGEHYCVKKDTVGQFTGLKDKNGADIYSGDIIQNEKGDKSFIVFSLGSFHVNSYYGGGIEWYVQENEVIGNIHINPELLK